MPPYTFPPTGRFDLYIDRRKLIFGYAEIFKRFDQADAGLLAGTNQLAAGIGDYFVAVYVKFLHVAAADKGRDLSDGNGRRDAVALSAQDNIEKRAKSYNQKEVDHAVANSFGIHKSSCVPRGQNGQRKQLTGSLPAT